MWTLLIAALAAEAEPPQGAPDAVPPVEEPAAPTSALAVFAETPPPRVRDKVIRYAMRKAEALSGGKDWGRALCFNFDGPADLEVLQKAAQRAKMPAELRPVDDCTTPPPEALVEAPSITIAVHLEEQVPPAAIRNGLMRLLGIGGLGLTGVKTLDEPSNTFCMEFVEAPSPSVLDFMLQSLPFRATSTETVATCRDAFL